MRRFFTALTLAALSFVPIVALAQPKNLSELADTIIRIINVGTGVLLVVIIAVYFWGLATNMSKSTDEGQEKFRFHMTWGLLTIFVVFAFWGILNLLKGAIFP